VRFQRIVQTLVFALFIFLLWRAAYPLVENLPVDIFLRFDPLISLGVMGAVRRFIPALAWALVLVALTFFLGRLFCGYICPMGATIDFTDRVIRKKKQPGKTNSFEAAGRWRTVKYLFLTGVLGTTLLGVSSLFLFSPLSLITRFYSLVIYPPLMMFSDAALSLFQPLFPRIGLDSLSLAYVETPRFDTNLFVAALAAGIFAMGLIKPRFWCRNLCPAGALYALCSKKPLFRRRVSEDCTACGRCLRACPMAAIGEDFVTTAHTECVVCLKCQEICPENAISFSARGRDRSPVPEFNAGRRAVLTAGAAGVGAAAIAMTSLNYLHAGEAPRALRASTLIRPPGALPEVEFQERCVRCGECMKACLTNTLQPVWFEAGLTGLWSPRVTPRLAACEQKCNVCGHVCPTGAIRPLPLQDKKYAKIGTAAIEKSLCLAWEQNKKCLICDEICPYNAISTQFAPDHTVTVPVIDEDKCNGCGYCEMRCPVTGKSAIRVSPQGELRLAYGSYEEKARELKLIFHAKDSVQDQFILDRNDAGQPSETTGQPPEKRETPPKLPPGFITGGE